MLVNLQNTLASLQQGNNEEFLERRSKLEVERDFELTKLRLWEEYQVKTVEQEYKEDLAKAKENHDLMIKLIKQKLYDKLQKQIKQLKEEKLLLNLVNANLWSVGKADAAMLSFNGADGESMILSDRRSLRKREVSSRLFAGEMNDLSDGPGSAGNGHLGMANGYASNLLAKRRRHYATRYSSNDEMSSGVTSTTNNNGKSGSHAHHSHNGTGAGGAVASGNSSGAAAAGTISESGNDSNLSEKDYDALNSIIMNHDSTAPPLLLVDSSKSSSNNNRPNTRGSSKQFVGLSGLKPEELNDDLNLLRSAIVKKEK